MAWLHVNCGTTCHNRNSGAKAWSTGLFLRLEPTLLDGRSVAGFDSSTTTIGMPAVTAAWKGRPRIEPGDPAHSLLFDLISHRGSGEQMPPIATSFVDRADVPLVEAWIAQLPSAAGGGAGRAGGDGGATDVGGSGGGGATDVGGSGGGCATDVGGSGSGGS